MKTNLFSTALVAILGLAFASVPVTSKAQTSTDASAAAATTAPASTPAATNDTTMATSPAPMKKSKKKSDKTPYSGSVTAMDASSVTVTSTKKTLTLAITPMTKFAIMDGKKKMAATAADFAVGDKVTGSFTMDATGAMMASSIHKKKSMAASSTMAPAATTATPAPATAPMTQ